MRADGRCPVWANEIWTYEASDGWRWRADYLASCRPYDSEQSAYAAALAHTCADCGMFCVGDQPHECAAP